MKSPHLILLFRQMLQHCFVNLQKCLQNEKLMTFILNNEFSILVVHQWLWEGVCGLSPPSNIWYETELLSIQSKTEQLSQPKSRYVRKEWICQALVIKQWIVIRKKHVSDHFKEFFCYYFIAFFCLFGFFFVWIANISLVVEYNSPSYACVLFCSVSTDYVVVEKVRLTIGCR